MADTLLLRIRHHLTVLTSDQRERMTAKLLAEALATLEGIERQTYGHPKGDPDAVYPTFLDYLADAQHEIGWEDRDERIISWTVCATIRTERYRVTPVRDQEACVVGAQAKLLHDDRAPLPPAALVEGAPPNEAENQTESHARGACGQTPQGEQQMRGGHYNYAYTKLQDMAESIEGKATSPLRRAFAKHLLAVAKAMKDIEWEDSGDGADWETSVRAVLHPNAEIDAAKEALIEAIDAARRVLGGEASRG